MLVNHRPSMEGIDVLLNGASEDQRKGNGRERYQVNAHTEETLLVAILRSNRGIREAVFVAHLYHARKHYRLVCERPNKGNKAIEREVISRAWDSTVTSALGSTCCGFTKKMRVLDPHPGGFCRTARPRNGYRWTGLVSLSSFKDRAPPAREAGI